MKAFTLHDVFKSPDSLSHPVLQAEKKSLSICLKWWCFSIAFPTVFGEFLFTFVNNHYVAIISFASLFCNVHKPSFCVSLEFFQSKGYEKRLQKIWHWIPILIFDFVSLGKNIRFYPLKRQEDGILCCLVTVDLLKLYLWRRYILSCPWARQLLTVLSHKNPASTLFFFFTLQFNLFYIIVNSGSALNSSLMQTFCVIKYRAQAHNKMDMRIIGWLGRTVNYRVTLKEIDTFNVVLKRNY
jgi:hypothetical protein